MSTRRYWNDLPEGVRLAVEHRTGKVVGTESTPGGRNSELSETLRTDDGRVFCKGITTDSRISYMHQNEISISPFLPRGLAPQLLWHFEADGWLLLGFEYLSGQHADLSPDSADLPLVAESVMKISHIQVPLMSLEERPMAAQWARALNREIDSPTGADPWSIENAELVATWASRAAAYMIGSTLIHSDLNPANFLVSDRAQVVDWAWWQTGAPWFDPAYLTIRLIASGHDPESAEKWAQQFDGFASAPPEAITAFAASALRMWQRRFPEAPPTKAALRWTQYRLG